MTATPAMTMDDFVAAYDDSSLLLDVREPDEYADGHVPGAVLLPLGQVAARASDVPTGRRVYVICRSGRRSLSAVETLATCGVPAVSVDEGTLGWAERGRPLVAGLSPR